MPKFLSAIFVVCSRHTEFGNARLKRYVTDLLPCFPFQGKTSAMIETSMSEYENAKSVNGTWAPVLPPSWSYSEPFLLSIRSSICPYPWSTETDSLLYYARTQTTLLYFCHAAFNEVAHGQELCRDSSEVTCLHSRSLNTAVCRCTVIRRVDISLQYLSSAPPAHSHSSSF
jgi:hypothetical protein